MTLWAVRIGRRYAGDGEMIYMWKRRKDAYEYAKWLHEGEVVKVTVHPQVTTSPR